MREEYASRCRSYLDMLCTTIKERFVGSQGNRQASDFIVDEFAASGWETETPGFRAVDWYDGGAELQCGGQRFEVFVSPYAKGFRGEGGGC